MRNLADPIGKVLLDVALKDKTGWRLNYLYEIGLITKEDLDSLNAS